MGQEERYFSTQTTPHGAGARNPCWLKCDQNSLIKLIKISIFSPPLCSFVNRTQSEIGCDSLGCGSRIRDHVPLRNCHFRKIKEGPPSVGGTLNLPSFRTTRHVCLGGALARPCTISVAASHAPELHCCASRQHGSEQGHGGKR